MRYAPIGNNDEYEQGIDVGYDDYVPPRTPASARKYVTVDRPVTPQTTLRKASQGATPTHSRQTRDYNAGRQTVEVTKTRGNDVLYGSNFTRPRHTTGPRSTDGDTQVTTNLKEVRHPRYGITRRGFIVWGAALAVSLMATKLGMNTLGDIYQAIQEGQQPGTGIELVCGHSDGLDHPTLLYAFVQDRRINLIEQPGGDAKKSKIFPTQVIPVKSEVRFWHIEIVPQLADDGHYQIVLTLKVPDDNNIRQWLLVDSGQGFFRAVNPK